MHKTRILSVCMSLEFDLVHHLVQRKWEFLETRPTLARNNRDAKIGILLQREITELLEALESDVLTEEKFLTIVEEIPDVLLFAVQHWLFQGHTTAVIASTLITIAESTGNHPSSLDEITVQLTSHLQALKETQIPNEQLLGDILATIFSLATYYRLDITAISHIKETYNAMRYLPHLFELGGLSYEAARTIVKEVIEPKFPKKTYLYPELARAVTRQ